MPFQRAAGSGSASKAEQTRCRKQGAHGLGGVGIDIIHKSEEPLPWLQLALRGNERAVLRKCEKGWHQGVPLFPAFSLEDHVGRTLGIMPNELPDEWEHGIGPRHVAQSVQHGLAADGVKAPQQSVARRTGRLGAAESH